MNKLLEFVNSKRFIKIFIFLSIAGGFLGALSHNITSTLICLFGCVYYVIRYWLHK